MKTCPTCKNIYTDDTLNFCLDDGAILLQGDGSKATPTEYLSNQTHDAPGTEILTKVSNGGKFSSSQNTPDTAPSLAPTFQDVPQNTFSSPPPAASNYKFLAIIGGTLCFGIIGGLLIAFSFRGGTGAANTAVNNLVVNSKSNNVANTQPLDPDFSFKGTWSGRYGKPPVPAGLNIERHTGRTFSGTLDTDEGYSIAIEGEIDYQTRQVLMKETKVIKNPGIKDAWLLGENDGIISSNGKAMAGGGENSGSTYRWSFIKD